LRCKWLNEKRDTEISARLIPLVDDLTHILLEAAKNKLHETHRKLFRTKRSTSLRQLTCGHEN
jgi:hypothetical protein